MNNRIIIKYDPQTPNVTIECDGRYFETERLSGIDISEWAYPFSLKNNRWNGLYEELKDFFDIESFSIIFHGTDNDLSILKKSLEGQPVNVVGLNNKVIIIYDSDKLTTKITINGKIFDTSKLMNRTIDEWVNPFSFKENEWKGIFTEIEDFLGTGSFSIQFMGKLEDMNVLMDHCPEEVNITYKPPTVPKKKNITSAPKEQVPNIQNSGKESQDMIVIKKPDMNEVKSQAKGLLQGAKNDYLEMQDKDLGLLLFGMLAFMLMIICAVVCATVNALAFVPSFALGLLLVSFGPNLIFCILSFTKGYKKISRLTLILSAILVIIPFLIVIFHNHKPPKVVEDLF